MDSVWRWTVFSVFIISSHNNVLVMCQNVMPNRPLPSAPILRETDCPGAVIGPTPQQMNSFNYNIQRNLERGPEINPQCLEYQRPIFQDYRPVPAEFIRPLEPINGCPCPLSVNTIQQSNIPQSCPTPLQTPTNTVLSPINLPKTSNNVLPFRETVSMNSPLLPQNTPLPRLEQGCSVPQQYYQDILPQQGHGIPLQLNRIIAPTPSPPAIQGPTNLQFNPNTLPSCAPIPILLPQTSTNLPKIPLQEQIIPPNSAIPSLCPSSGLPNPNFENYPSHICSQYPTAQRPFNLLPPPKLLSPVPNLLPMPFPFNSLRTLPFGPNSVSSSPANILQNCPIQNPPVCPLENQCGNQMSLPKQDMCPLSENTLANNQQSNIVLQPSPSFPIINGPNLQGSCPQSFPSSSLPSLPTYPLNNVLQNQNLPIFPIMTNSYQPSFIPSPNFLPPCNLKTDLSSIQFLPQPACLQPNLINNILIPLNPLNIAAPLYQTTALPPVLPVSNVCDYPCQNPIEESTAPAPINLQINIPPPIITPPKIIIVAPSPPTPPAIVEEDTSSPVKLFPPYPMPPIIIEGRRSRSRNWLPLLLVALCSRNECYGSGGNCCSGNSDSCSGNSGCPTVIPFPIPIPTSTKVINS